MPALNIDFTDAELAELRERARTRGLSMRALAHDTIVDCISQDDADSQIMTAYARIRAASDRLLAMLADQ